MWVLRDRAFMMWLMLRGRDQGGLDMIPNNATVSELQASCKVIDSCNVSEWVTTQDAATKRKGRYQESWKA